MKKKEAYTILLLEDDVDSIELLNYYIRKYCPDIKSIYCATSVAEAMTLYLEHRQDILILDIELNSNETCFQLFKDVPNINAQVLCLTAHSHYAIKAINNMNLDAFLLKPLAPLDFAKAMHRIIDKLKTNYNQLEEVTTSAPKESKLIAIPSFDKIDIVNPNDILYVQADGRYTIFHFNNGTRKIASRNLGEYEKLLDSQQFFRIHHSYIVNLRMVTKINKTAGNYCELLNNKSLPIAKRRQDLLHRFLKIK